MLILSDFLTVEELIRVGAENRFTRNIQLVEGIERISTLSPYMLENCQVNTQNKDCFPPPSLSNPSFKWSLETYPVA